MYNPQDLYMNPDKIILNGVIKECLRGTEFLVEVDVNGEKKDVIGYISGKMRKAYIKVVFGDRVRVELSKYDLKRGRIIQRVWKLKQVLKKDVNIVTLLKERVS